MSEKFKYSPEEFEREARNWGSLKTSERFGIRTAFNELPRTTNLARFAPLHQMPLAFPKILNCLSRLYQLFLSFVWLQFLIGFEIIPAAA
jgi:hypothetical protein